MRVPYVSGCDSVKMWLCRTENATFPRDSHADRIGLMVGLV